MNRFLFPVAAAALLAGCARPGIFGLQPNESVEADSALVEVAVETAYVVQEIPQEVPVYYADTVYYEEEPAPAETVYVEEEYETYVYVPEPVLMPPPPHHHRPRWSPREHEQRPSRPPGDEEKPRPRVPSPEEAKPLPPGGSPEPEPPSVPAVELPAERTYAPVTDGREKSPDRPTPPKRQAPAQGGSAPVAPAQHESPNLAPTPPSDKSAGPEPDTVQVQVGMNQSGTGLHAARTKK